MSFQINTDQQRIKLAEQKQQGIGRTPHTAEQQLVWEISFRLLMVL